MTHLSTSNPANDGCESAHLKFKVDVSKCYHIIVAVLESNGGVAVPVTSGLRNNDRFEFLLTVNDRFLGRRELGCFEECLDSADGNFYLAHSL